MGQPELIAGRYIIVAGHRSRTGGSGAVRKAIDITDGSPVAVKFLSGADHLVSKFFEREVSLLESAAHPNIVRLLDHGVDDTGTRFLVLNWVEKNLTDVLDIDPPMTWLDFSKDVLRPLALVLKHLHTNAIEHRDLKPANVLWEPPATPMLADFGIAKQRRDDDRTSMTVGQAGSPLYAPPELSSGPRYVRDVYSLGVLTIQALTPSSERAVALHELLPRLDALKLPSEADALIRASIALTPTDRPRNGGEFLRALDAAMAAELPRPRRATVRLRLTRRAQEQACGTQTTKERAEAEIEADLSGPTYGALQFDPATQAFDPSTFILCGEYLRLKVTQDKSSNEFVIVSARRPEYEDLERQRESSLRIETLVNWTLRNPLNPLAASRAQRDLLQRLREYHEALDESSMQDEQLAGHLLGVWRRLLTAREALGMAKIGPQEYRTVTDRGRAESRFVLTVPLDEDLVGTEWKILDDTGRLRARGSAVQHAADEVTLKWSWRDETSLPTRGSLTPYLGPTQTALDRQRDAVQRLESGQVQLPILLNILANPSDARTPRIIDEPSWVTPIDESKQDAVRAALGARDCTVVSGPPGTGKTRMIAELVAQELAGRPDARVLLVSQTHVALDNAVQRLAEIGVTGVVRMGRDDDRVADASKKLLLDVQLRAWARTVRAQAEAELSRRAADAGLTADQLRGALQLQEWMVARETTEYLKQRFDEAQAADESTASRMELIDDPDAIREKLVAATLREKDFLETARLHLQDDLEIDEEATALDIEAAIELILGQSEEASQLVQLMRLQAEWLQRVALDDRLASVYLGNSRVIAGTCLGFIGHRAARDLTYDLCIVDEASKATSTETLVPLVRASRFMLVGDTSQLPPLDEDLLRDRSILDDSDLTPEMVRETLFDRLAQHLPTTNKFTLKRQYRMVPAIGNLISECFYEGKLESEPRIVPRGADMLGKPVLWLSTSSLEDRRETRDERGAGSYVNHREAMMILERLTTLDEAVSTGLMDSSPDGIYNVLVIAPYRSQVVELERRIARMRSRFDNIDVEVESVDAVQGRECDFAFFSVTRSNSAGRLGFLGETYWRRINVALSRARYGLTVVGDAQFCEMSQGGLKRVIEYARSNPASCEVRG